MLVIFGKRPYLALKNIINERVHECGVKLLGIIIYFNYLYHKERLPEILKNEYSKEYVYDSLIIYQKLFQNLKLEKDQITLLLEKSSNFREIKSSLSYSNNLFDILMLITNNFTKIYEAYILLEEEYNNQEEDSFELDKEKIDVAKIVKPNKSDNMEKISELFKNLIDIQRQKEDYFILFTESFFGNYAYFFSEEINLDNLFYLKDMINYSKEHIKEFRVDIYIDKIIHNTGFTSAEKGLLKNLKLLEFIEKDTFYNSKAYNKKYYRSLYILNGLNINEFDEGFYNKWKKINWNIIFETQYSEFLKKIANLVNNIKDFKILFKLLNFNKDDNYINDFEPYALTLIQNKFLELYKNYVPEKYNDEFYENTNRIILCLDKKNIQNFLENNLQISFNEEIVDKIYMKILSLYDKDISSETKEIIYKYFSKGKNKLENLTYLMCNNNQLSNEILQNLQNNNINEQYFFNFEESEYYNLIKGLFEINSIFKIIKNNISEGEKFV